MTRRTLFAAAVAVTAVAAIPFAIPAAAQPDRAAWEKAKADYERTVKASRAAHERYYDADDAFRTELPSQPPLSLERPAPLPGKPDNTIALRWHSEKELRKDTLYNGTGHDEAYRDARAELLRQWDAYAEIEKALRARYNVDRLGEEADRIGNAECQACNTLITTPAPDAAALAYKLELMLIEWGAGDPCDEHKQAVIDDARRLAGLRLS